VSKDKIKDDLDADLVELVNDSDSHESKVEVLLLAILRELKKIKDK